MKSGEIEDELLEDWALAYLGRYASSVENLRQVLLRRVRRRGGFDREQITRARGQIDRLLARYTAAGLLDDGAYAAGRARALARRGAPRARIAARLRAKGLAPETVKTAIGILDGGGVDADLPAACAFAKRRRLGPWRHGAADPERELGAFARAGFERRTAEAVLACTIPEEAEALGRRGEG